MMTYQIDHTNILNTTVITLLCTRVHVKIEFIHWTLDKCGIPVLSFSIKSVLHATRNALQLNCYMNI